jgi:hypothetical protein
MENIRLHILTRCTRPDNLLTVYDSIIHDNTTDVDIDWHIIFDTTRIDSLDAPSLSVLYRAGTHLYFESGTQGENTQVNGG